MARRVYADFRCSRCGGKIDVFVEGEVYYCAGCQTEIFVTTSNELYYKCDEYQYDVVYDDEEKRLFEEGAPIIFEP